MKKNIYYLTAAVMFIWNSLFHTLFPFAENKAEASPSKKDIEKNKSITDIDSIVLQHQSRLEILKSSEEWNLFKNIWKKIDLIEPVKNFNSKKSCRIWNFL